MALVRLPNKSTPTEINNFDLSKFKKVSEYDDEIFGWYKGTFIALVK